MNATSTTGVEKTPPGRTPDSGDAPSINDIPSKPTECEQCSSDSFSIYWKLKNPDSDPGESRYGYAGYQCSNCHHINDDHREEFPNPPSDQRVPSWQEIFGHPEPYDHQTKAIKEVLETGGNGGFVITEGGCGTGKTMIGLTAGLRLVRNPQTKYRRLFILTSVKQQLTQFEDDLRIINRNLPNDVPQATGVTLVGKGDLCPYAREGKAGFDQSNVNQKCQGLRNNTNSILSNRDVSGQRLARINDEQGEGDWGSSDGTSPYPSSVPNGGGKDYCPFYAKYQGFGDPTFRFDHAKDSILDVDEMVRLGVEEGFCPHSSMSSFASKAEVVIGNYYHCFDQNTLRITRDIIDEHTLIICDEAHMLEPRVRSILSRDAPLSTIEQAADEVARVVSTLSPDAVDDDRKISYPPEYGIAFEEMQKKGLREEILEDMLVFLDNFGIAIRTTVNSYLNDYHSGWKTNLDPLPNNIEIPLREPDSPEPDLISKWVDKTGVPDHVWKAATDIASYIEKVLEEADEQSERRAIGDVAKLLTDWFERDHVRHFRELTLEELPSPRHYYDDWRQQYAVSAEFHNVFPRRILGTRLTDFGGGLLMSATIAPMDIYTELVGLDYFDETGGEVIQTRYSPSFPQDKRLSLTLDLPKFTHTNRGSPGDNTKVRNQYAQAITSVVRTTQGNVLVCMPSYREAKWAAKLLSNNSQVSKDILIDESSTEKETKRLKDEFFAGPPKVITTSLKGTLTEGVDYKGDRLSGCIVCGVPIDNVQSPKVKAVHRAYQDRYNNYKKGFEYGLTLPAVRKARQALGRVIRSTDDVGVRVLVDHRYAIGEDDGGLKQYLSPSEQDEYTVIDSVNQLSTELQQFWRKK